MEWVIICNTKAYDVVGAFKKFDVIEWKQSINVKPGDIVYIYITGKMRQIKYKCLVIKSDLQLEDCCIDDSEFTLDGSRYENYKRYMRLQIDEEYVEGMFTLEELREHGLKTVQGPSRINSELHEYLERRLRNSEYSYPKKYISPISILIEEWCALICDKTIFYSKDIDILKKIYIEFNHATSCSHLVEQYGGTYNEYKMPMISLAKRISNKLNLKEIKGTDGKRVYWRILFWGRRDETNHDEWKIRPELAAALSKMFSEWDKDTSMCKEIDEIKAIEDNIDIKDTEKEGLIKNRVGQGILKQRLILRERKCKICGLADPNFLIASHIKPWSQSDGNERLDVNNAFLLCPQHDAAFDKGYISFDREGNIMISRELNQQTLNLLNISSDICIKLTDENKKYLKWHREHIFKK